MSVIVYPPLYDLYDLNEANLYTALAYLGVHGDARVVVHAPEGCAPRMAEINGHRHCVGLAPVSFEPFVHDMHFRYVWRVEVNGKVFVSSRDQSSDRVERRFSPPIDEGRGKLLVGLLQPEGEALIP